MEKIEKPKFELESIQGITNGQILTVMFMDGGTVRLHYSNPINYWEEWNFGETKKWFRVFPR